MPRIQTVQTPVNTKKFWIAKVDYVLARAGPKADPSPFLYRRRAMGMMWLFPPDVT
jgi:hypothetical protein